MPVLNPVLISAKYYLGCPNCSSIMVGKECIGEIGNDMKITLCLADGILVCFDMLLVSHAYNKSMG